MPIFISLLNWTDQGIRAYETTIERSEAFTSTLEGLGARLVALYWTEGPYDLVSVIEAPDDKTAVAAMLRTAELGNVRSTTFRAFDREEIAEVIAKATG
ncbi:GYD domain-containing protein [Actinomadura rugatobispora]|uniref:GYD domain-containing protein n=1 Tax=Actinomadura rugatobispora TaxID=1994 RepID=A0ABW1AEN4_9ACTN|nr:GYD domain-containing protein [Actinomadura rugatobispora]